MHRHTRTRSCEAVKRRLFKSWCFRRPRARPTPRLTGTKAPSSPFVATPAVSPSSGCPARGLARPPTPPGVPGGLRGPVPLRGRRRAGGKGRGPVPPAPPAAPRWFRPAPPRPPAWWSRPAARPPSLRGALLRPALSGCTNYTREGGEGGGRGRGVALIRPTDPAALLVLYLSVWMTGGPGRRPGGGGEGGRREMWGRSPLRDGGLVRSCRPARPNPEDVGAAAHMGAGTGTGTGSGTATAGALGAAVAALYTATLPPTLPGGDAGNVPSAASPPASGGGAAGHPVGPGRGVTPPGRWHRRDPRPIGAGASRSPLGGGGAGWGEVRP